jgi:hypothetical protein
MTLQSAPRGSSCFSDLSWDDETNVLSMSFIRGGTYQIENFSADEWDRWSNAESLGGYFNANIKGHF